MSEQVQGQPAGLPENAYKELKAGEKYVPIVSSETGVREVTVRSVVFGLLMTIIFSAAAAYIALKLGQGIETAIPISILAIGYSAAVTKFFASRMSSLTENVNILAIGATSGIVVGGSVFTMPAIYVLGLKGSFLQIFIVPFLGAVLGVLFLIPFRRYFTHEMHGKLPFPEATATTEILVTGEKGGNQAVVLLYSLGLGIVLDYLALSYKAWTDTFTTAALPLFQTFTAKFKAVFAMSTSAAVLGLGYIIGIRYASIIMAGSMLSYFVLIPLFAHVGGSAYEAMSYTQIFGDKLLGVRNIGIGGIFAAGVISILKMSPVIKQALQQMMAQILKKKADGAEDSRLDRDIKMSWVVGLIVLLSAVIFFYFRFGVLGGESNAWLLAFLSLALTLLIVFLFSAVSAWAVAMISVTPISGMTLTTLIIAAVIMSSLGLKGPSGMLAILLIGGVVCTALSMSGSLVTQFKIGYWLGSTPKKIQWSNIIGSAFASLTVTAIIMLFAHIYGYGAPSQAHPHPLAAPQASAMAAVVNAFLGGQGAPWMLYALGAVIAVIVSMLGISALAFALGMYLPIELNSPILLGAVVAWLVQHSTKNERLSKARNDKGILLASGLIAGGALAGVFDGFTKMAAEYIHIRPKAFSFSEEAQNWIGLVVFLLLACWLYWDASKAKAEE
jgi:putative OPT family oligopeptide transporter